MISFAAAYFVRQCFSCIGSGVTEESRVSSELWARSAIFTFTSQRIFAKSAHIIQIIIGRSVCKQLDCLCDLSWEFRFQIRKSQGSIFQNVMKQGNAGGSFICHLFCKMNRVKNIRNPTLVVLSSCALYAIFMAFMVKGV